MILVCGCLRSTPTPGLDVSQMHTILTMLVCDSVHCYDCRKSAVETAEGLYKQARKRRRAVDKVVPLLEVARDGQSYLE